MPKSSDESGRHTVAYMPEVTVEMRRLVVRGKQLGIGSAIVDALLTIVRKLQTMPLEWGDPLYATKQTGGLVLRGFFSPLFVEYVAFEQERVVCMLKIHVFPGHPLESA
jgi:hypothetical protein